MSPALVDQLLILLVVIAVIAILLSIPFGGEAGCGLALLLILGIVFILLVFVILEKFGWVPALIFGLVVIFGVSWLYDQSKKSR